MAVAFISLVRRGREGAIRSVLLVIERPSCGVTQGFGCCVKSCLLPHGPDHFRTLLLLIKAALGTYERLTGAPIRARFLALVASHQIEF